MGAVKDGHAAAAPPEPGRMGAHEASPAAPVIVGKITAQYGVKGWIKVYSYTRPAEQILGYRRWVLAERPDASDWQAVRVVSGRRQSQKLLAKLAGVDDRNTSAGLAGKWVAIAPSQLSCLPEGEYYWSDLIGLAVVNRDGVELGRVDHLVETGANDVLVVRRDGEAKERLVPWSPDAIIDVDTEGRRIRVGWDADFD